jgi:hypothetical protein
MDFAKLIDAEMSAEPMLLRCERIIYWSVGQLIIMEK